MVKEKIFKEKGFFSKGFMIFASLAYEAKLKVRRVNKNVMINSSYY